MVVAGIDVDGLKAANDTYGHAYGDNLLRTVAHKLQDCCRIKDFALRAGGDEFLLILREVPHRKVAWLKAALNLRLQTVVQRLTPISFSYGIVGGDITQLRSLLLMADQLMYAHKRQREPLIPQNGQLSLFHSATG